MVTKIAAVAGIHRLTGPMAIGRAAGIAGGGMNRGWVWIGAGVIALGAYGFVATLQPDANFGRILAAYGGVFVAGSLLWGVVADGVAPTAGTSPER